MQLHGVTLRPGDCIPDRLQYGARSGTGFQYAIGFPDISQLNQPATFRGGGDKKLRATLNFSDRGAPFQFDPHRLNTVFKVMMHECTP
ncbi:hypothetical protein NUKP74_48760 [Klebsiella quasipneumoniae]|nr:hypothetical protein NUKP74_48760 [Klebsiella quasipneumoniae]